jgi:BlaI family penicillinase repressor
MNEPHPTEGELAILRILWRRATPVTVREVHEELLDVKDTAYTTVLKMLTIMAEKGLVGRDESERSHRYFPLYSEPVVQSSLLKNFLRNAFSGSAYKMVQHAIDADTASDADLDAIGKLIAEAKQRRGK